MVSAPVVISVGTLNAFSRVTFGSGNGSFARFIAFIAVEFCMIAAFRSVGSASKPLCPAMPSARIRIAPASSPFRNAFAAGPVTLFMNSS